MFTPMLREFHSGVAREGFEVVFVSSDRSEDAMISVRATVPPMTRQYFKADHGDWFCLNFYDDQREALGSKVIL
jgi:hypothetical protein